MQSCWVVNLSRLPLNGAKAGSTTLGHPPMIKPYTLGIKLDPPESLSGSSDWSKWSQLLAPRNSNRHVHILGTRSEVKEHATCCLHQHVLKLCDSQCCSCMMQGSVSTFKVELQHVQRERAGVDDLLKL